MGAGGRVINYFLGTKEKKTNADLNGIFFCSCGRNKKTKEQREREGQMGTEKKEIKIKAVVFLFLCNSKQKKEHKHYIVFYDVSFPDKNEKIKKKKDRKNIHEEV